MITREQVADLQPGDVITVTLDKWPDVVTRGPLVEDGGTLRCGPVFIRYPQGGAASGLQTLTVVSRAPRPLYVNHPRTEPRDHDVVRDGDGVVRHCDATGWAGKPTWWSFGVVEGCKWTHDTDPSQPLTLLVDGETGQVVP